MEKLKTKNETPSALEPVRENQPAVSFDVSLGKKLKKKGIKEIDFDYGAWTNLYRELNGPPYKNFYDTSDVNIHIGKPGLMSEGSFSSGNKTIEINAPTLKNQKKANKMLAHESKHLVDAENGRLKPNSKHLLGNLAVTGNQILFAPYALATTADILSDHIGYLESMHGAAHDAKTVLAIGAMATAAVGLKFYYNSPEEKRARKAAKEHDQQIIKLTPLKP